MRNAVSAFCPPRAHPHRFKYQDSKNAVTIMVTIRPLFGSRVPRIAVTIAFNDCPIVGNKGTARPLSRPARLAPCRGPTRTAGPHNKMHRSYEVPMQDFLAHITGLRPSGTHTYAGVYSAATAGSTGATAAGSSAAGSAGAAASGTGSVTGSSGPGSPAAKPSWGNFDGDGA